MMTGNKFKDGDIIHEPGESYKFLVLKKAKTGDIIRGKWFDGLFEKEIPTDCYIIEGMNSKMLYLLGFDFEEFYEAIGELVGEKKISKSKYPNECDYCKKPAYKGLNSIQCSNPKCFCYDG